MGRRGVTILELLIALVISAALVAGIYRVFLTQKRSFEVQDDVVDMQQNARTAITEMLREIRMAGFGNVQSILPVTFSARTYPHVLNIDLPVRGGLTVLVPFGGPVNLTHQSLPQVIRVSSLSDDQGRVLFDGTKRIYLSVAGTESAVITQIDPIPKSTEKEFTLNRPLVGTYKTDGTTPVYAIRAVTYRILNGRLVRDGNLGGGAQTLAEEIEHLLFQFYDEKGQLLGWTSDTSSSVPPTPAGIRNVKVTVTARTRTQDRDLKAGDGYRRREVASNVLLRNMGL